MDQIINSSWLEILQTFGGVCGIIGAIIAGLIKYQSDKKLEQLKSDLSIRNHSCLVKFDKEIEVYSKITPAIIELIRTIFWLFPQAFDMLPEKKEERKQIFQKRYNDSCTAVNNARKVLEECSIFIPTEIYELTSNLIQQCKIQCDHYPHFGPTGLKDPESVKISLECLKRTTEISSKYNELTQEIRKHIEKITKQTY